MPTWSFLVFISFNVFLKITSYSNLRYGIPIFAFQLPTFNMVSQKGALYDDDSHKRGDGYFSDKSQGY
jgi:hypothetical protein